MNAAWIKKKVLLTLLSLLAVAVQLNSAFYSTAGVQEVSKLLLARPATRRPIAESTVNVLRLPSVCEWSCDLPINAYYYGHVIIIKQRHAYPGHKVHHKQSCMSIARTLFPSHPRTGGWMCLNCWLKDCYYDLIDCDSLPFIRPPLKM